MELFITTKPMPTTKTQQNHKFTSYAVHNELQLEDKFKLYNADFKKINWE